MICSDIGETPLIIACDAAEGGDTDEETSLGYLRIMTSCAVMYTMFSVLDRECVDLLLEAGADASKVDEAGRSAVAIAAANGMEGLAIKMLTAARLKGSSGATWLNRLH